MKRAGLSRRLAMLGLAAGGMLPALKPAGTLAAAPCQPGPVILTIGGLVGAPDRGPLDPVRDRLFHNNDITFEKARAFTAQTLYGFRQETVKATNYGIAMEARGPLLRDILDAASPLPDAKAVRFTALDNYAAEIPLADARGSGWILAMEADGRPLAIGEFGPLFAMRPLAAGQVKTEEEEQKWVHSLYYIELVA